MSVVLALAPELILDCDHHENTTIVIDCKYMYSDRSKVTVALVVQGDDGCVERFLGISQH